MTACMKGLGHHCLVLSSGILAALSSVLSSAVLVLEAFYKDVPSDAKSMWLFGAAMSGVTLIGLFHALLISGRIQWVWAVVLLLSVCFFMTVPTIEHRPVRAVYYLGVMSPVIGLIILNSNAHCAFRASAVLMRNKRKRLVVIRLAKAQRLKIAE